MIADTTSETESPVFEVQQRATRVKYVGGLLLATALLLTGAAVIHKRRGLSFNENKLTQEYYEESVVVPPYDSCSKTTENCLSTKCCKVTGYMCFLKSPGVGKCMTNCTPGKDGICTEAVATKAVASYPGLKFFCFSWYMADTGSTKKSYDLELLSRSYTLGASIFGCPKWAVYSDVEAVLGNGAKTTQVFDVDADFHLFKRKKEGTWVNAMMFYQAWLNIREQQLSAGSDWVIKVDADSVFLPARLLTRLQGYHVPAGGVYIENCANVMYGFFGNLEVVSGDGFQTFLTNLETCKATLAWKGDDPDWKYGPWGEDLFMQNCMDKFGVSKQSDFTMDADGMCKKNHPTFRKSSDGGYMPYCKNSKQIVYHPFRKPADYFKCLAETQDLA